jgi:tRNA(Ile)-lysidine synthase TilS/MesJ
LPVKIADRCTITKFAVGRSLDDAALEFFLSLLKGCPEGFFGDDPKALLPVITPFISVPGSEVDLYADIIAGGCIRPPPEPPACRGFEQVFGDALDSYTERHPATKYSLLQLSERIRLGKKREDAGPDPGPAGKISRDLRVREPEPRERN